MRIFVEIALQDAVRLTLVWSSVL